MKPTGDIVLITGANGRIGTALMRRLRERFDNVVGFDRRAPSPPPVSHCPARWGKPGNARANRVAGFVARSFMSLAPVRRGWLESIERRLHGPLSISSVSELVGQSSNS